MCCMNWMQIMREIAADDSIFGNIVFWGMSLFGVCAILWALSMTFFS